MANPTAFLSRVLTAATDEHEAARLRAGLVDYIRAAGGKQKAIMAVTHKILVIAWNLLSSGALYDDPGAAALRTSTDQQMRRRAVRQLEALGYQVTVEPRGKGDAA